MTQQAYSQKEGLTGWRKRWHEIIFEAETPEGRLFDVWLLVAILLSILIVMLESVSEINMRYGQWLRYGEWFFTLLFTLEYIARLLTVRSPWRYAISPLGIIDLLSILPTYMSLVLTGTQYFMVIRVLRLLRVFRILKLAHYVHEARVLGSALQASREKIIVFLMAVLSLVIILGTITYWVEGPGNGFTSIPRSIYWAIVTLTTVGYGDIAPQTPLGQFISSLVMILGYGILAVPTGIVTSELTHAKVKEVSTRSCDNCGAEGHDSDAEYCKYCGGKL